MHVVMSAWNIDYLEVDCDLYVFFLNDTASEHFLYFPSKQHLSDSLCWILWQCALIKTMAANFINNLLPMERRGNWNFVIEAATFGLASFQYVWVCMQEIR